MPNMIKNFSKEKSQAEKLLKENNILEYDLQEKIQIIIELIYFYYKFKLY